MNAKELGDLCIANFATSMSLNRHLGGRAQLGGKTCQISFTIDTGERCFSLADQVLSTKELVTMFDANIGHTLDPRAESKFIIVLCGEDESAIQLRDDEKNSLFFD
jgi:hypothetical protein